MKHIIKLFNQQVLVVAIFLFVGTIVFGQDPQLSEQEARNLVGSDWDGAVAYLKIPGANYTFEDSEFRDFASDHLLVIRSEDTGGSGSASATDRVLRILDDHRLLRRSEASIQEEQYDFINATKEIVDVPVVVYDLTDLGREYFESSVDSNLSTGRIDGFRIGRYELDSIDSITPPQETWLGLFVSEVEFSVSLADVEDWYGDAYPSLQDVDYPHGIPEMRTSIEVEAELVFEDGQWIVNEYFDG